MDFKHIKTIRTIAYILTSLFLIGAIWFGFNNRQIKVNHLQAEIDILENYRLNEPFLKDRIVNLEYENGRLKQDVSFYKGKFESDELYIDVLESDYIMAISYITVAELIIERNYPTPFIYTGRR